ncbi:MAG: hypothetical protein H0T75_20055 [Rhizobiales bacterium]|nr:hypothetical protein [Hyphomicrobiales bacterium]MDQ3559602.1 hypothetical protein [Pseudomonadota bacterium]
MILLTATRIDIYGHFEFRIEGAGLEAGIMTSEALDAAKVLASLGVENPLQLVAHAREWGSVEISEPVEGV